LLGGLVCGCATPPSVSVSDFGVYTSLNLIAVDVKDNLAISQGPTTNPTTQPANQPANNQSSLAQSLTSADMHRYFESTSSQYANSQERMDQFLDGVQRRSAFIQSLQTSLEVNLVANLSAATTQPAATQPATTQLAAATTQAIADLDKSSASTTQPTSDSPFDTLDRVTDFYTAYLLKSLRVSGDARTSSPEGLVKYILLALQSRGDSSFFDQLQKDVTAIQSSQQCYVPTTCPDSPQNRLILLLFQSHVWPGSEANMMTGVRIHIDSDPTSSDPDPIKIIALHPSKSYDLDSGSFDQSEQTALSIAAAGSGKAGPATVQGSVGFGGAEADEERLNYLSRVSKEGSYADAATHTYGFDFYPSNVVVRRRNPIEAFFTGRPFKAEGYLEPGAHDCAFLAVFPPDLRSFKCWVTYFTCAMPGDEDYFYLPRKCYYLSAQSGTPCEIGEAATIKPPDCPEFVVTLPKWNSLEALAATVGAAPVLVIPTTQPTTAPSSLCVPATNPAGK
jgi:hypothetical protein